MDEAVLMLRARPEHADLVRDAYLGENVRETAERFRTSTEFAVVRRLLGDQIREATVVDIGAGNGIASWAFARSGAAHVYAVDPNPSDIVGLGALRLWVEDDAIEAVEGSGESIPLADAVADIVYARQVLHHATSLDEFVAEVARVLKPGGTFLATREHVAETEQQLTTFLAQHDLHTLVGGEHAYPLDAYVGAIERAGLRLERVLGPWDSVINAFPVARTEEELAQRGRRALQARFGVAGAVAGRLPGVERVARRRLNRRRGGEMYSFLARR